MEVKKLNFSFIFSFKFLKKIFRLSSSRIILWDGNWFSEELWPWSIKFHNKSLTCPWQFMSIHSRVTEEHVALLNTFFLLFTFKSPKFLQLCFSLAFSFSNVFNSLLEIIHWAWKFSYLNQNIFENRRIY